MPTKRYPCRCLTRIKGGEMHSAQIAPPEAQRLHPATKVPPVWPETLVH